MGWVGNLFQEFTIFLDGQSGFVNTEENRDNYWRLEVQIQISSGFIFLGSHLFSTRTNHTEDCICPRPRVTAKFPISFIVWRWTKSRLSLCFINVLS